ncbi:unnamed protein product [Polarella glacialis]|uniref:Uncharacterized protein n=1 Tax=Polarella glacialis TaxID=89957 RepID=A0A813JR56_POLGL|nr:unnamed protein product [Polarella glacialis]
MSTDGVLAKKEFDWYVCLNHYEPWVLEILEGIWDFDIASLVLLGEPNCGKSPLGRSVLMAQRRHNKTRFAVDGNPCIRTTTEIDFLRGEVGSILMGDYLDDGSLKSLPMKVVKALLDVGLYEAMAWARWGATKWVANEPRAVADQFYNPNSKCEHDFWPSSTFQEFYGMIRPAFNENASEAEINAVFKRAAFLVNSKTHVYYRKAGVNEDLAQRKQIVNPEYLTPEGKKLYGLYKSGHKEPPANHAENIAKEQVWVEAVTKKRFQERREREAEDQGMPLGFLTTTSSAIAAGTITAAMHSHPAPAVLGSSSSSSDSAPLAIKKEIFEKKKKIFHFKAGRLAGRGSQFFIDLDMPSPPPKPVRLPDAFMMPDDLDEDVLEDMGEGPGRPTDDFDMPDDFGPDVLEDMGEDPGRPSNAFDMPDDFGENVLEEDMVEDVFKFGGGLDGDED